MKETDQILESLLRQVTDIMLETETPGVDRLANVVAVLISTLIHERAQSAAVGTTDDRLAKIALGAVCPENCDTPCDDCLEIARRTHKPDLCPAAKPE